MKLPTFQRLPNAHSDASGPGEADDRPVAELLDGYARSLSPDDEALSRMGAAVRAAFAESVTLRDAGPESAPSRPGQGVVGWRRRPWSRRRAAAAICAVAILTLSTVGLATAESGPGQPFYRLRLGIEAVNLPPAGSQNRLVADLGRADSRLDDVASSAATSDWSAAADAASAYVEVMTGVALPADMTARGQTLKHLDDQLARLEQLRAGSHGAETAELDKAIAALCQLLGIPVPTPPASPTPSPTAHPSDHGRNGDTPPPSPTVGESDGGHDHGRSPQPNASKSPEGPGDSDGDAGTGGPGSSASDHPSPTTGPSASHGDSSGTTPPPTEGH
jgi:hypothetical protein